MKTYPNTILKLAALLILAFAAPKINAQAPAIQSQAAMHTSIGKSNFNTTNTTATEKNYTLYEAQNFPIIEGPACSVLVAMDEREHFDYDLIFACAGKKKEDTKTLPEPSRKASKHRIPAKLNS